MEREGVYKRQWGDAKVVMREVCRLVRLMLQSRAKQKGGEGRGRGVDKRQWGDAKWCRVLRLILNCEAKRRVRERKGGVDKRRWRVGAIWAYIIIQIHTTSTPPYQSMPGPMVWMSGAQHLSLGGHLCPCGSQHVKCELHTTSHHVHTTTPECAGPHGEDFRGGTGRIGCR